MSARTVRRARNGNGGDSSVKDIRKIMPHRGHKKIEMDLRKPRQGKAKDAPPKKQAGKWRKSGQFKIYYAVRIVHFGCHSYMVKVFGLWF